MPANAPATPPPFDATPEATARPSDRQLLDRFARTRDESAFAELLRRHGRLVLGVARRQLADRHAAEDVLQATFLTLARHAARLRTDAPLEGWLHTIAYRLARKERDRAARRLRSASQAKPTTAAATDPLDHVSGRECLRIIDEELLRLPEQYRLPLLLCGLDGLARDEAAARLGWTLGTLRGNLERGRALLRQRLTGRGVLAPALLLGFLTAGGGLGVTPAAAAALTRAALAVPLASGLTGQVVRWAVALILLVATGTGAGVALRPGASDPAAPPALAAQPEPPAVQEVKAGPRVDRYGDPLPEGAIARIGTNRLVLQNSVVGISPDEKLIAATGTYRPVRIWDTKTGKLVAVLKSGDDTYSQNTELGFSPDSRLLAVSGFRKKNVELWDVGSVKLLRSLPNTVAGQERLTHWDQGRTFAFTPDGKTLLVAGKDGALYLWEVATGKQVARLASTKQIVLTLAATADAATALTAHEGGEIHLWDVNNRRHLLRCEVPETPKRQPRVTHLVALSQDGVTFARCANSREVEVRQAATGKTLHRIEMKSDIVGLAYAPGGILWIACDGGEVEGRDAQTGERRRAFLCQGMSLPSEPPRYSSPNAAWFSPSCQTVAWSRFSTVRFWDLDTGLERAVLAGHRNPVSWVRFSADGDSVMTASRKEFGLWDPDTGREHKPIYPTGLDFVRGPNPVHSLSADRRRIVLRAFSTGVEGKAGDETVQIYLWDPAGAQAPARLAIPAGAYTSAVLTPDHRFTVVSEIGGRISVYLTDSGQLARRYFGRHIEADLTFTPDGAMMASVSAPEIGSTDVRLYDFASGRLLRSLSVPDTVFNLAMAPDGQLLSGLCSVGLEDPFQTLIIWNLPDGRERFRISTGHTPRTAPAFSPNGRLIVTGGEDSSLRLWESATGQERRRYLGHEGGIWSVDFSPDGKRLATSSSDCTALIWQVYDLGPADLTEAELAAKWADLAKDGITAHKAIGALLNAKGAVPFLAKHLQPVREDPERTAKLLADLESPRFADRDAAEKELTRLGDHAAPALRKALADSPTEELRQRAERLLKALAIPITNTELLRSLRAVEALEHIGTPDARAHLRTLAMGADGAELTRAAVAALKRLEK